ncbi:hypothetical protein [Neptunicoccus sediminis]|uniref:hypothetical protein n=1 Tax=Neptunicoccus sediminis TaxID=1892596 RepID=UPI0012FF7465|nr:hypothetical protein [Neptunicoccus sediminis]
MITNKLKKIAAAKDWDIVSEITNSNGKKKVRLKNKTCDCVKEVSHGHLYSQTRSLKCRIHGETRKETTDLYIASAEERGFEYVGRSTKKAHVELECENCGAPKTVHSSNLVRSSIRCRECDLSGARNGNEAAFTYLARVTMPDGYIWIKHGSTRMLEYRIKNLSSKNGATVELLAHRVHPNRKEAFSAETDFKATYASFQIDYDDAIKKKIVDGKKEAFTPDILAEIGIGV